MDSTERSTSSSSSAKVGFIDFFKGRIIADLGVMTFIAYLVLLKQFLDPGLPAGTDSLGFVAQTAYISRGFRWLYVWRPYGFGFAEHIHLLDFILTSFYAVFGDPSFAIKFFVLTSFLLAEFTMYAYVFHHTKRHTPALLAGVIYLLNQWLFVQFAEGHFDIIFSYALAPLLFLLLDGALEKFSLKNCLSLALMLWIFATGFHPQCVYIYGFFLPLYFFLYVLFPGKSVQKKSDAVKRLLKVVTLSGFVAALLSSFVLLPLIFGASSPYFSATYGYPIEDAYKNVEYFLGSIGFHTLFFLVPLAAVAMVSFRGRHSLFFFLSAVVAAFIAKGPLPPFGEIFSWLYVNLPYMHVFRAVKRWFMVTMLSYAFLTGLFVSRLETSIKGFPRIKGKFPLASSAKSVLSLLLIGILLANAGLSGSLFLNATQTYSPPEEVLAPLEWLNDVPGDFRLAQVGPFGYGDSWMQPGILGTGYHELAYDSYYLHDRAVLQEGGWDPLARDFFFFTHASAQWREIDGIMQLLGTFNVKYTILPFYAQQKWRDIFNGQRGAKLVLNYAGSLILENQYWTPRIFAVSKYGLVLGGRAAMTSLLKVPNFNLSSYGLIYVDQNIGILSDLMNSSDALILWESDITDLAMLLIGDDYVIPAGQYAYPSTNSTAHWIATYNGRDVGKLLLSRLTLTTSGNNSVTIPFTAREGGEYEFWIRIGFSDERGNLTVMLNDVAVGTILPEASTYSKFDWLNLGSVYLAKGTHNITLVNDGTGYNDIDAVAMIPPAVLESKMNEALNFIRSFQGRIIILHEAEDLFGKASPRLLEGWEVSHVPFNASNGFVIQSIANYQNTAPKGYPSASSVQAVGLEPKMANDGRLDTRWASEFSKMPQLFQIEWDEPRELWKVRVIFEEAYAETYRVQTWDGYEWVDQVAVENNTSLECDHLFDRPITTSKLRLYFTYAPAHDSVSLREVEAYSTSLLSTKVRVPRKDSYTLAVRLAMPTDPSFIEFELGNVLASFHSEASLADFKWCDVGPIQLDAGEHELNISYFGDLLIDEIMLHSLKDGESVRLKDLFETGSPPKVSYQRINPSHYVVHANCTEPFLLMFSDTYHPLWEAKVNGLGTPHIVAYSFINGFFIDKGGEFDVTLYFIGQTYANVGLSLSATTLISVVAILLLPSKLLKKSANSLRTDISSKR